MDANGPASLRINISQGMLHSVERRDLLSVRLSEANALQETQSRTSPQRRRVKSSPRLGKRHQNFFAMQAKRSSAPHTQAAVPQAEPRALYLRVQVDLRGWRCRAPKTNRSTDYVCPTLPRLVRNVMALETEQTLLARVTYLTPQNLRAD